MKITFDMSLIRRMNTEDVQEENCLEPREGKDKITQ